jgi:hypothetical protein
VDSRDRPANLLPRSRRRAPCLVSAAHQVVSAPSCARTHQTSTTPTVSPRSLNDADWSPHCRRSRSQSSAKVTFTPLLDGDRASSNRRKPRSRHGAGRSACAGAAATRVGRLHVAEERRRRPPPGGEDGRARGEQLFHTLAVRRQGPSAPTSRSTSAADGGRSNTGPDCAAATSCSTRAATPASRAPKSLQVRSSEASRRSGSLSARSCQPKTNGRAHCRLTRKQAWLSPTAGRTPRQPVTFLNPHGFRHPDTPAGAGDRAPAQALRRSAHALVLRQADPAVAPSRLRGPGRQATRADLRGAGQAGGRRRRRPVWAVSLAERTAFGRSAERRPPVLSEAPRHPGGVDDAVAVEPVVAAGAFADMGGRHRLERPVGLQDLAGVGERRRRRARGVGGRRSHQ